MSISSFSLNLVALLQEGVVPVLGTAVFAGVDGKASRIFVTLATNRHACSLSWLGTVTVA